jgi:hypothetical protein
MRWGSPNGQEWALPSANSPNLTANTRARSWSRQAVAYIDTRAVLLLSGDGGIVVCYCCYRNAPLHLYTATSILVCALPFQTAWGSTNHKRVLEAGKEGSIHSTSIIESIGHRSIAKTKAHHGKPSGTNNRTVTAIHTQVLHVQDRPPPSLHARFTSPPSNRLRPYIQHQLGALHDKALYCT